MQMRSDGNAAMKIMLLFLAFIVIAWLAMSTAGELPDGVPGGGRGRQPAPVPQYQPAQPPVWDQPGPIIILPEMQEG